LCAFFGLAAFPAADALLMLPPVAHASNTPVAANGELAGVLAAPSSLLEADVSVASVPSSHGAEENENDWVLLCSLAISSQAPGPGSWRLGRWWR
jgi:hypothetical protein